MSDTQTHTPEQRLHDLGHALPHPPKAVAVYLPFKRVGDQLLISGQIATLGGDMPYHGRVGGQVTLDEARECAKLCTLNILAQVKQAVGELSFVKQVVKISVFVASEPSFVDQHLVANGASELLGQVFGEAGKHARSAVGVTSLPLDSPVEIEAIFEVE